MSNETLKADYQLSPFIMLSLKSVESKMLYETLCCLQGKGDTSVPVNLIDQKFGLKSPTDRLRCKALERAFADLKKCLDLQPLNDRSPTFEIDGDCITFNLLFSSLNPKQPTSMIIETLKKDDSGKLIRAFVERFKDGWGALRMIRVFDVILKENVNDLTEEQKLLAYREKEYLQNEKS